MKTLSAFILLMAAISTGRAFDHFAENDNIREAIIRYEFTKYPNQASLYFVSVYDSKTDKEIDPSDGFLKRFAGSKPRIAKASESKYLKDEDGRLVDIQSGKIGMLLELAGIIRKSEDTAEVNIYSAKADNLGGGFKAILVRKNGKWEVERFETVWLP